MIKKFLAVAVASTALIATQAMAQHHGYGHRPHHGPRIQHHHYSGGGGWIAPLIGGVIVGSIIADANARKEKETVIVQDQPVIIRQQSPVYVQQAPQTVCTAWKEILSSDGSVYRERTCYQQ